MISIKKFLFFFYAFIVIYLPNFSFISPLFSVASLSIIFLVLNIIFLNRKLFSATKIVKVWPVIVVYLLMIGYISVLNVINGYPVISSVTNDMLFIIYILNILSLLLYYKKIYGENTEVSDYLIKLGLFQAVIIFLMLLIPQFKELANIMYSQGNEINESLVALTEYRVYGLGSAFTFTLPLIQGLIAVISLYIFDLTNKIHYFLISLVLILSSVFNARTPLYIYMIIFVVFVLKWMLQRWNINKLMGVGMLLILVPIVILFVLQINESGLTWIVDGFEEIISLVFESEATGNIEALTGSHWFFPSGITFIFGIGLTASSQLGRGIIGRTSDIGYVNHMFKGGLIYTLTIYATHVLYIFKGITSKFFTLILLFYLLGANYKGEIFVNNMIIVIVYLLIFETKLNRNSLKETN